MNIENMDVRIKNRTDTLQNWETFDPVLYNGEIAISVEYNTDGTIKSQKIKVGDGTSNWSDLPYVTSKCAIATYEEAGIVKPDGTSVAIDSDGKISAIGLKGEAATLTVEKTGRIATVQSNDINGITTVYITDGKDGKDGVDGTDGVTPYIDSISGNWVVNGVDTGISAKGPKGDTGEGFKITNILETTSELPSYRTLENGKLVVVKDGGRLFLRDSSTFSESNPDLTGWIEIGDFGSIVAIKGDKGDKGDNGDTPMAVDVTLSSGKVEKHWFYGTTDSGVIAEGIKGDKGDPGEPASISITSTDNGTTLTVVGHYFDSNGNYISTTPQKINRGYTPKLTTLEDVNQYKISFEWLDDDGIKKTETVQLSKHTFLMLRNKQNNGVNIYLNPITDGLYHPDTNDSIVSYDQLITLDDGFSPNLTITQLNDDAYKFSATKQDGTVQEVEINTGWIPEFSIDVDDDNDHLTHLSITDVHNVEHKIDISSAEISASDKEGNHYDITVNDGVHGQKTIRIYDGENAYDDSAILSRLSTNEGNISQLRTDVNAFVGFTYQVASALPTTGDKGVIYLIPSTDGKGSNLYDEFIYLDTSNTFEQIGSSITIKPDETKGLSLDSTTDTFAIKLSTDAGNTLSFGTDNGLLSVAKSAAPDEKSIVSDTVNNTFGINLDSATNNVINQSDSGLSVKIDDTTIKSNTSNELYVVTATDSVAGVVKPDNTTISITDGVISTNTTAMISAESGQQLESKSDGIYYSAPGGDSTTKGLVQVDGKTIVADTDNVISVNYSSDSGNTLSTGSDDGIYLGYATDTVAGAVTVDKKTIVSTDGKISINVSQRAISNSKFSKDLYNETYTYTNNNVNEDIDIKISYVDADIDVKIEQLPSRSDNTTITSGEYTNVLNYGDTLTVTTTGYAIVRFETNMIDNIVTVEDDGLMVNRYSNLASNINPGFVIPDNDTVTIDDNGVISATVGINSVSNKSHNLITLVKTTSKILSNDSFIYKNISSSSVNYRIQYVREATQIYIDNVLIKTLNNGVYDGTLSSNSTIRIVSSGQCIIFGRISFPDIGTDNVLYRSPNGSSYDNYRWNGTDYEFVETTTNSNEDGIYIDEDETVPIATYDEEGKVRPDGDTIVLSDPTDDHNGQIKVNTEVIATQQDILDVNNAIDNVDVSTPTLVEYTEDELYEMAWSDVIFTERPEYTTADLDAILDTIDFSSLNIGGGTGGTEMSASTLNSLWDSVFTD